MDALNSVLAWVVLAAANVVFLAVEIWLLTAARRTPRRAPPEPLPATAPRYRLSPGWEIIWTLLPALALLALGPLSAQALLAPPPAPPPGTPATPTTPRGLKPSLPRPDASLAVSTGAALRPLPGARTGVPRPVNQLTAQKIALRP